MLKPTVIAIPIFALLIALETMFAVRREAEYDRRDVWTNIALGFGSVAFGFAFGLIQAFFYNGIYEQFAVYRMPENAWWSWTLLFVFDDFLYYWFHRFSHEVRFFWNFHVVHHSSNQYNLSVAVRQSWFSGIAHWIFYLPAALAGFPLWMFTTVHGFNLIYQFWIHTKTIDRLPAPLEFVFNTPSHHRVHHGVNEQYLDRNYGGILIIFDRMFGTFTPETEPVRYGITTPLRSYNWLWINVHAWAETFAAIRGRGGLGRKFRALFGPPSLDAQAKPAVLKTSTNL